VKRPDIRRLPKRGDPQEAQCKLLQGLASKVVSTESVALAVAVGRVLASDVYSNLNIPAYDKTFIDGYAINPLDTCSATPSKPAAFTVIGKLFPADYPTDLQVTRGEAVYVATGAPIPTGAYAAVKVEETRLKCDRIEIVRPIKSGEGIIPLGDDVKQGALLLSHGRVLRPQDVGLLASVGLCKAEVYKKPVVAILSGGDELIKRSQKDPEKIPNNYALVVRGLAEELGATAVVKGIMPDVLELVERQINEALAEADFVITIGGSSVGMKDFVPDAVNRLGKPGVVVQGINLRPGAVSGFGMVNEKPVIMLPGHIGSCIAGFYFFVAPLIRQLSGLERGDLQPHLSAELAESVDSGPQFRFLFVALNRARDKFIAAPVEGGSSALSTIVKANGYAIIPPHKCLAKNANLNVFLFGKLETSQVT